MPWAGSIHRWDGKALEQVADLSDKTVFCLSDGIVDSHDRMYIGDIGYNFFDPANQSVDTCVISCIGPDGSVRVVADGLSFPNGMVITPDGKTLIVAETTGHRLTAFDILGRWRAGQPPRLRRAGRKRATGRHRAGRRGRRVDGQPRRLSRRCGCWKAA